MDQMFTGQMLDVVAWTVVVLAYGCSVSAIVLGICLLRRKPARRWVMLSAKATAAVALSFGIALALATTAVLTRPGM